MIGGLNMYKWFRDNFALTEKGSKDVTKSVYLSFGMYVVQMLPPLLLMMFLDELLLGNVKSRILYYGIAAFILIIMYFLLNKEYDAMYNTTYSESANLRLNIAEVLRELPLSYFSKHDLSDIAQTIMADVTALEHAISHAMSKVGGFALFFPIIAVLLLIGNLKLGLAVVIPLVIDFALIFLSKNMQLKLNKRYYDKLRKNSDAFQEAIELQQEIKAYGLSEEVKSDLYKKMEEGERYHTITEFSVAMPMLIGGIFMDLSIAIVIIVASSMYINGEINILYLIGYLLASMKLKEAAAVNAESITELFYLDARAERIKEIKNHERQTGKDMKLDNYDIVLENVYFAYDKDTPVLKGLSFTAKQNEVTALIGKSGCGKTSVLRLISRLYDYDKGSIKVGGVDIKDISTKSLFENISIVFQDVTLFNNSIMENIRIGRKDATDEEVMEAARLANCEEFISKLSDGYDTYIGENGAKLSGGERQRLSIARAFLKDAPIILLDEIAAALDMDNEKKIQDSLNKLIQGKTVIIISHRLKSIENVDKIVAIDDGVVDSIGAHGELIENSKLYKDLVHKSKLAEEFVY